MSEKKNTYGLSRRRGRPSKAEGEALTEKVAINLRPDERALLDEQRGDESVSEHIRFRLFGSRKPLAR